MTFTKPNGKRRVVVTGGGMISALGRNWDEAYSKLKERKNFIKYMQDWNYLDKLNTKLACPYTEELPNIAVSGFVVITVTLTPFSCLVLIILINL